MSRDVTTPLISERVVSMSGVAAVTSTASVTRADLEREQQRLAGADGDVSTFSRTARLKPCSSADDGVAAGRQERDHVVAFAVGQRAAQEAGVAVVGA